MEIAYLSLSFKRKFELRSVLLITTTALVVFALLAGYLLYLANQELDLSTDPPPIIIKSGSFIIESEKILQPDSADQRNYKNLQFNAIKGIRVITYSENARIPIVDKKFFEGKDSTWEKGDSVQVNIYIQSCQQMDLSGLCTSWSSLRKVEVFNANSSLEINVPSELHLSKSKKNKKNKRQYKNEDENTEIIRFYLVEIINKTKNSRIDFFNAQEGQEFYIGFYNALTN